MPGSLRQHFCSLTASGVPRARALSVVVPMVGWLCWIGLIDVDVCMGVPQVYPGREKLLTCSAVNFRLRKSASKMEDNRIYRLI